MSAASSRRRRGGAAPPVPTNLAILRDRGVPLAIVAVVFMMVRIGFGLGDYPGHRGTFALTAGLSIVLTAVPVLVLNRPCPGGRRPAEAGPYLPLCVGIAIILDAVLPARVIEGIPDSLPASSSLPSWSSRLISTACAPGSARRASPDATRPLVTGWRWCGRRTVGIAHCGAARGHRRPCVAVWEWERARGLPGPPAR